MNPAITSREKAALTYMDVQRRDRIARVNRAMLLIAFGLFLCIIGIGLAVAEPTAAKPYRSQVIRNVRVVWGMDGPVAMSGAQIQQESGWNPNAHSSVADGLAEFTPATAQWISGAYHLGPPEPYNPSWAIRALATYDHDLWPQVPAADNCDQAAFMLSAYNGGVKWYARDKALARIYGVNDRYWFDGVEGFSTRSAAAFKENRGYPKRILLTLEPEYRDWGYGMVDCDGFTSVIR